MSQKKLECIYWEEKEIKKDGKVIVPKGCQLLYHKPYLAEGTDVKYSECPTNGDAKESGKMCLFVEEAMLEEEMRQAYRG